MKQDKVAASKKRFFFLLYINDQLENDGEWVMTVTREEMYTYVCMHSVSILKRDYVNGCVHVQTRG